MIKLDDNLLQELGLQTLPKEEKAAFLKHMYETLEMRVGTRLAERMSEQQMSEFEQFISANDEQGAFRWLESNFPNYKDVVAEEFEKLKAEIRPMVPQIVAASQAQMQAGGQPHPGQPQQGQHQMPAEHQQHPQQPHHGGQAPQYPPADPGQQPPQQY